MASSSTDSSKQSSSTTTPPSSTVLHAPPLFSVPSSIAGPTHSHSYRLDMTNYLYWKALITPYLIGNNLMQYIDGELPCPAKMVTIDDTAVINPAYTVWRRQDQLLISTLLSSISPELYHLVIRCHTSKEIWDTLQSALASPSQTRIISLKIALQELKFSDKSIASYLKRAKALADELYGIGAGISDAEFNVYVLKPLRTEAYKDIVTNLLARPDPVTFDELQSHLLSFEFLNAAAPAEVVVDHAPEPTSTPVANYVQKTPNYPKTNQFRGGKPNQFRGGQSGRDRGRRGRGYFNHGDHRYHNEKCQICGYSNHTAINCRYRHDTSSPSANFAAYMQPPPHATGNFQQWFPDTGATHHITPDISSLSQVEDYKGNDQVKVGNGAPLNIANTGKTLLHTPTRTFHLNNVLHVPSITKNLLSVQKFSRDNDSFFEFHRDHFCVKDRITKTTLMHGPSKDGLYYLASSSNSESPSAFVASKERSAIWHHRLGHPAPDIMAKVFHVLGQSSSKINSLCSACQMGKSHRLPLPPTNSISHGPLQLIHSDVWGPSPSKSVDGFQYYVTFLDDFSKFVWFYPMKLKSEVFSIFHIFQAYVER